MRGYDPRSGSTTAGGVLLDDQKAMSFSATATNRHLLSPTRSSLYFLAKQIMRYNDPRLLNAGLGIRGIPNELGALV
jgi:hypothetical protein